MSQHFHSEVYVFKRSENTCPHKTLYENVQSRVIHNSQKVEIIQMPINGWISNESCHSDTMEYYWTVKKWSSDRCYNMHEPCRHWTKCKKSVTKDHVSYDFIIGNVQNRHIHGDREQTVGCLRLRRLERNGKGLLMLIGFLFRVMKMF